MEKLKQKSISGSNGGYIQPKDLFGYNKIEKDYNDILLQFNMSGNKIFSSEEEKIDRLTRDMVRLLSNNYEVFYGDTPDNNKSNDILYAEIRPYHFDQNSTDPPYLALEIYFKGLLSDKVTDVELEQIGDWRIKNSGELNPERLHSLTQSLRDYIIQRVSLIPWLHIDISNVEHWNVWSGIDIYSIDVNDDCGYAHFKVRLNSNTEQVLDSLIEEGKLEKISKDAYKNNSYELGPFERFTSGPLGPYDYSKRLQVIPFNELGTASSHLKQCAMN